MRKKHMMKIPAGELKEGDIVYRIREQDLSLEDLKETDVEFVGRVEIAQKLERTVGVYLIFTNPHRRRLTVHQSHQFAVIRL